MTGPHERQLERLKSSVGIELESDLTRDRQRLIADSFKFLRLAWEIDAETYQKLSRVGSLPVGEIVELYVSGTVYEIPGIDDKNERAVEITFAGIAANDTVRKLVLGFFIPKDLDIQDPGAIIDIGENDGVYATQFTEGDLPVRYWITEYASEPFIIPDADGGNDAGNYSALDYDGPDAEEILRAREIALIANLRESTIKWDLIPSKTVRKTEDGFEVVVIPS